MNVEKRIYLNLPAPLLESAVFVAREPALLHAVCATLGLCFFQRAPILNSLCLKSDLEKQPRSIVLIFPVDCLYLSFALRYFSFIFVFHPCTSHHVN
jgi:hypothetical protein